MRKASLLIVLLFLAGGLLIGQAANAPSENKQTESLPEGMSSHTGCLQSSLGKYTLVEDDGTPHELVGSAGKLKREVGHQIEVIGKESTRTVDRTVPGGASTVAQYPVFDVKIVKQIAIKCKAAD